MSSRGRLLQISHAHPHATSYTFKKKKIINTYGGFLLNIHFYRNKVQHPKITPSFTNKSLDHLVFVDFYSFSSLISYYKISKEKTKKSKCNEQ